MATIAKGLGSILVVTTHTTTDPIVALASDLDTRLGRFPLRQQPNDLPMASRHCLGGFPIATLDSFETQVGFDGDALIHIRSLSQEMISTSRQAVLGASGA